MSGKGKRKQVEDEQRHTGGRPSIYTDALAETFFELVAEGKGLREICKRDDMPAISTICLWLTNNEPFSERYARAKEVAAILMCEEILDIADNTGLEVHDTVETQYGSIPNKEWILRSKLRVDARLTLMEKLYPRKYGPKLEQKISGKVATEISEDVQEKLAARMAELAGVAATVTPPASFRGEGSEEGE